MAPFVILGILFKFTYPYLEKFGRYIYRHFKKSSSPKEVKNAPIYKEPEVQEVISAIKKKEGRSPEIRSSFMDDFKYPKEKTIDRSETPIKLTPSNKEILNNSIIISLYDTDMSYRKDLQFICRSRINGRCIYRYIGNNFSEFDLPFEEVVSFDNYYPEPKKLSPVPTFKEWSSSGLSGSPEHLEPYQCDFDSLLGDPYYDDLYKKYDRKSLG